MATTTVSIGSNQSIATLTPNLCNSLTPSSDGWEVGFTAGSIPAGVSVGDIYVAQDEASSFATFTFLVTEINEARTRCNLKYLTCDDGGMGSCSSTEPCSIYNAEFSVVAGTFKRAFSTITLFEAMVDDASPTYWGSSDDVVGECHGDSDFTDTRVYFSDKQSLASVKLTANSADRHDGTASGTGAGKVLIRPTVGTPTNQGIIESNIDNFILEWVEIDFDALDSTTSHKAVVLAGTNDDNIIRNNLIHDKYGNPGATGPNMIIVAGGVTQLASDTLSVLNNIIYNVVETVGDHAAAINLNQWDGISYIYNNTVYNIVADDSGNPKYAYGILFGTPTSATANVKNNLVAKLITETATQERAYYKGSSGSTANTANNLSDDTTNATYDAEDMGQSLNDSSALIGKTEAQIDFVSTGVGTEDLHIDTGSVCREAGVDLGTTNGVNFDIDNVDRDATGVTWDIGADQASEAGGATITGAVSLTASGTVSVGGLVEKRAATSLTGNATVSVGGLVEKRAATSLTGNATISVGGLVQKKAATSLTGNATVSVGGLVQKKAATSLTGNATVSVGGLVEKRAATSLTGNATVSVGGLVEKRAATSLTGNATVSVGGLVQKKAATSLTGNATVSVGGLVQKKAATSLTGNASINVEATIPGATISGAANLLASGSVSVSAKVDRFAATSIACSASTSVSGFVKKQASVAISASGSISVSGNVKNFGVASLTSSAAVSVSGSVKKLAATSLSVSASTSQASLIKKLASASISSSGTCSVSAKVEKKASASLNASTSLSATGGFNIGSAVSLSVSANINVLGKIDQFPITEEFIVYINTSDSFISSINTDKAVDASIETFATFEG